MKLVRFLLFPLAFLYGAILEVRNRLFDVGYLSSKTFAIPLIGVGNLATGGTGKSVVIDYLLSHFKDRYSLATLSRGYGRSTQGVLFGDENATAKTLGDEPYQFLSKHPEVTVVVAEKRVAGIEMLLNQKPHMQAVLLDDVLQHRWIKPQLQILTTTFQNPYSKDYLVPVGNLRERRKGAHRANIILVTKTPSDASRDAIESVRSSLGKAPHQNIYFCATGYSDLVLGIKQERLMDFESDPFLLVTGIANAAPLVAFLQKKKLHFEHLEYPDHYDFPPASIKKIQAKAASKKILTTEKDYGRLRPLLPATTSLYYLPIHLQFLNGEEEQSFLSQIEAQLQQN